MSTSIRTFRDDLAGCDVETVLVAPEYESPSPSVEANVVRVSSGAVPGDPEDRRMHWRALRRSLDALPTDGFDLVHIHTPFVAHYAGVGYAKRMGIPCIATYHTFFEEYLHHYVPVLPRRVGRFVARHFTRSQCKDVNALIAPSEPMREMLLAYGVATPIHVLPTGLPADRFRQGDGERFRRGLGIAPGRRVMTYVGRVAHEKNIEFLVRVFARVREQNPDAVLVIAGEGPAREPLRQLTERMGLSQSVFFVGYLERNTALLDCYAAADVFAFASRTETQGLVLLEAMAQGAPVVSTAELGTKYVLTDGMGAIVVPERVQEFAAAVLRVMEDCEVHARLAASGRDYALRWSSSTMARRLAEVYRATTSVGSQRQPQRTPPAGNLRKLERGFICAKLPAVSRRDPGSNHGDETRVGR